MFKYISAQKNHSEIVIYSTINYLYRAVSAQRYCMKNAHCIIKGCCMAQSLNSYFNIPFMLCFYFIFMPATMFKRRHFLDALPVLFDI